MRTMARTIPELSARTLTELRHLVWLLRTAGDPDAQGAPGAGLADLTDLVRDSGLTVDLDVSLPPVPVPEPVERAAYRTVREALTNIRKHAPGARARVRLRCAAACTPRCTTPPPAASPPGRPSRRRPLPGGPARTGPPAARRRTRVVPPEPAT
ncbi:sensor histidine kinase [Streptomyces luteogriseus]|uniref:hypothetical protein n=1 Tax=Streptomyces luteogriseus TaxID=68233 RepID=UPI0036816EDF